jgi:hypothetical protein
VSEYASWAFEEGEELQPGRAVLKTIGGGNRYEVNRAEATDDTSANGHSTRGTTNGNDTNTNTRNSATGTQTRTRTGS